MSQPDDEGVCPIGLELITKLIKDLVELGQVPSPNSCEERREIQEMTKAKHGVQMYGLHAHTYMWCVHVRV